MNDDIVKFQVNEVEITGGDILSAVDSILEHVRATNDLTVAENALVSLIGIEKVSGMAIAKLVTGLVSWWEDTNQEELTHDSFQDWAYSISTEFNDTYLRRCISIWDKQESGLFSDKIMERPIKDQQAIAVHLDQDYELTNEDWEALEDADTNGEVLAILRKAKGKPPRKSALLINLDRDGTLYAWKEGKRYFAGYLAVDDAKGNDVVNKAINRIVKNSGIRIE